MKKGFTLIELLAVIVILGILAVLIVPKVQSSINDAEKKANMTSAQNLIKAADYKVANNEITGKSQATKINYTNGTNVDYLDYSGNQPEKGQLQIRYNGTVAMAVKIGNNCYIKRFDSNDIKTISYNEQTCGENAEVFMNYDIPQIVHDGDGLYESTTEPGRLIYRGATPNNYITLKENNVDTTYRIVSYETDGTIKVIRDEPIGEMAWDSSTTNARNNANNTYCNYSGTYHGCSVWGNTNNMYYNGNKIETTFKYKYYETATSNTLQDSPNTGTVKQDSTLNTYLNGTWINTLSFKNDIELHSFYTGGVYYFKAYREGDKGIEKEKKEESLYTWNGKIGLLNISEYVESSINESCTSVYSSYAYNPILLDSTETYTIVNPGEWPCSINNWLYNSNYTQWTLSSYPVVNYGVWCMWVNGMFSNEIPSNPRSVRPVFYLKSSIKLGGLGTIDNPYYIVES
jgi:prepilin-type N-terminal cleavage/methylation domain-containing protein